MLYLKNTPIDQILSMKEIMNVIEDALKALAEGRGFDLPRRRIHHPNRMIFGLLPGSVHGGGPDVRRDGNRNRGRRRQNR